MAVHRVSRQAPVALAGLLLGLALLAAVPGAAGPVKVTVRDEKPVVVEASLPVDPTPRIRLTPGNLVAQIQTEQGQQLHLSHMPTFSIDGQVTQGGGGPGGRFEKQNAALPPAAGGKERKGFTTVYIQNDLRITMTAEFAPTRPKAGEQKCRLDSVLIRYEVENRGSQPRKFGLRTYMDVYVVSNDGAMFAAPNQPGKILDGVELKGKTLPDYVQMLERPDLKNPGYVAHLTLNLGSRTEKADRVVLTRHGAGFGAWDMPAMQSMGDSACGIFWEPKEIKSGGKREIAYAYGQGVALAPDQEGRFEVQLAGSFEPGKLFTVSALVHDPVPGQALTLELPAGMQAVEGRPTQPVPAPLPEQASSLVLWKARALQHGQFPVRVRSSAGVTQAKHLTIESAARTD